MGHTLEQAAQESEVAVAAIVGRTPAADVYAELLAVDQPFDCIVDFSHRSNTEKILRAARELRKPVVVAVTGLPEAQQEQLHAAAAAIPVVYSQNMSAGINALRDIVGHLSKALGGDYDIELIEKHHNLKEDAPSGTAQLLLSAIDGIGSKTVVNGRHGLNKRAKNEIGVHAVRGGTIAGEHSIIFAGPDEIIEIKHTALSKRIFAEGALRATRFIITQKPGLYNMQDVMNFKI